MEGDNSKLVIIKFKLLRAEAAKIFDSGELNYRFDKEDYFKSRFNPFYDSLEKEIKSLPGGHILNGELDLWVEYLGQKIKKANENMKLTEIGRIFRTHRRELKAKLLEIQLSLIKNIAPEPEETNNKAITLLSFQDIFIKQPWQKYISALHEVESPVISNSYEFIGNPKRHKGIICCWIKELQNRGIIGKNHSRQQLTSVLNKEIKNLNLGNDGKTFDNISNSYENDYKRSLLRLINLLP